MESFSQVSLCKEQKKDRGFALIITVVLVAFLVLILVGLATFTRVETQVAGNTQQLASARQNALLALNLAVGELQRTAGPDQRITATADILAATHPSRARLTGVWRADTTDAPEWLISGTPAQRTNLGAMPAPGPDTIELVGDRSANTAVTGNRIVVPLEDLRADVPGVGNNQVVGRIGWWVGDEGVKARVNLVDTWASAPAGDRINSWNMAQRAAGEQLRDDASNSLGAVYPANDPELRKLLERNQLPFLGGNNAEITLLQDVSRARFHDISLHSRSVLTNVREGGLRRDLTAWLRGGVPVPSNTDYIFTPGDMGVGAPAANDFFTLPTWGLVRDFNNLRFDGAPIVPRVATDTQQGISPVLTYARIGFAISGEEGGVLRLHLFPIAVLWNPYSVPLAAADYEFGMFHRNSNNARITFHSGSETGPLLGELHLARASFPTAPPTADRFFRFRIAAGVIPPGESHVFMLPDAADGAVYDPLATTLTRGNRPQNSVLMLGTVPLPATHFPPDGDPPESADSVYWVRDPVWNGQGEVDAALRLVSSPEIEPFEGRDLRASALQLIQRFAGQGGANMPSEERLNVGPLGPLNPRFGLAMEAKMGSADYVNARWIASSNYRAQLNLRTVANPDNPDYRAFINNGGIPVALPVFDGDRASSGRRVREVPAQNVVLAEILPINVPLVSLAQLQHANLARLSSYPGNAVGNSHPNHRLAGELIHRTLVPPAATSLTNLKTRAYDFSYGLNQALWDRYFLSTVPSGLSAADINDADYALPNSRLSFFRADGQPVLPADLNSSAGFERAAVNLMLDGGFNINSTSVEAWRALIASRNGLVYNPQTRAASGTLTNPISRFSVPVGGTTDIWAGYRTLTDDQVDQLAQDIVAEVRARGPFRSLADFINRRPLPNTSPNYAFATKGTLQAALDATTTGAGAVNNAAVVPFNDMAPTSTPTTGELAFYQPDLIRGNTSTANVAPWSSLMAFAPGMISQADLLNALGPLISARSDTFVIRTYGEAINPVTGERSAQAYLEAVVQRVPDYVNSVADDATVFPPTNVENQNFGRRFVVVGFRWLSPADI